MPVMTEPPTQTEVLTARPASESRYFKVMGVWVGPRIRVSRSERIAWGLTSLICAIVLGTAVYLQPSPAGHGTHEGLGMPPCGFMLRSGLPCPTCGMTTSFSHIVRGNVIDSFMVQPAGFVLALLSAVLMLGGGAIAATGQTYYVDWNGIAVRLMMSLGLVILFGWGFKLAYGLATAHLPMGR
jgi:hypothetical protein